MYDTNWAHVINCVSMSVWCHSLALAGANKGILTNIYSPGHHRVLLLVTKATSTVDKGTKFEREKGIRSTIWKRGHSLHGKYDLLKPNLTECCHRWEGSTVALTRPSSGNWTLLNSLDKKTKRWKDEMAKTPKDKNHLQASGLCWTAWTLWLGRGGCC